MCTNMETEMNNYSHGAFDHWYNSDVTAESSSRLYSEISSGERSKASKKSKICAGSSLFRKMRGCKNTPSACA